MNSWNFYAAQPAESKEWNKINEINLIEFLRPAGRSNWAICWNEKTINLFNWIEWKQRAKDERSELAAGGPGAPQLSSSINNKEKKFSFCWIAEGVDCAIAEFTINKPIPSNQLKIDWWLVLFDSFSLTFIIKKRISILFSSLLFLFNWAAEVHFSLMKETSNPTIQFFFSLNSTKKEKKSWWVD